MLLRVDLDAHHALILQHAGGLVIGLGVERIDDRPHQDAVVLHDLLKADLVALHRVAAAAGHQRLEMGLHRHFDVGHLVIPDEHLGLLGHQPVVNLQAAGHIGLTEMTVDVDGGNLLDLFQCHKNHPFLLSYFALGE